MNQTPVSYTHLNANMQIMGVYSEELVEPMAQVLVQLGVKKGMVVYGTDSLDAVSYTHLVSVYAGQRVFAGDFSGAGGTCQILQPHVTNDG